MRLGGRDAQRNDFMLDRCLEQQIAGGRRTAWRIEPPDWRPVSANLAVGEIESNSTFPMTLPFVDYFWSKRWQVLTDVVGPTGQAVIRDIVAGQRDPKALARHRNRRVKVKAE